MRRRGLSQLVAGTAATNLAIALGAAVGGVLLTRGLSPFDRGVYAIAAVWSIGLQAVSEIGLFGAIVHFVGGRPSSAQTIRRRVGRIVLVTSVIAATVFCIVVAVFAPGHLRAALVVSGLLIPGIMLAGAATFTLYGLDVSIWNRVRAIQPASYVCAIVGLIWFGALTPVAAVIAAGGSIMLTGVAAHRMSRRRINPDRGEPLSLRALLRYAIPNAGSSGASQMNQRIDQLLLGFLTQAATVGLYAVAVTLASIASTAVSAIGHVALPRLSRLRVEKRNVMTDVRHTLWAAAIGGATVCAALAASAHLVVPLLFGQSYAAAAPLVVLLAPMAWGIIMRQVSSDVLRGLGAPGRAASVELVLLGVTAGVVLVAYRIGAVEAVAATVGVVGAIGGIIMAVRAARLSSIVEHNDES